MTCPAHRMGKLCTARRKTMERGRRIACELASMTMLIVYVAGTYQAALDGDYAPTIAVIGAVFFLIFNWIAAWKSKRYIFVRDSMARTLYAGFKQALSLMAGGLLLVWLVQTLETGNSPEQISIFMIVSVAARLVVAVFDASDEYIQQRAAREKESEDLD